MAIDFSLWLFIATLISGIIYFIDKFFFEKKRFFSCKGKLDGLSKKEKYKLVKAPFFADYARSLFVVLLVVFVLRSFMIEPYRVPTGSLLPTIKLGDFILVNKFAYGIRWPFGNKVIVSTGTPKSGDIVVFHYPVNPNIDYIKRVIGLPGDEISYINKVLTINGKVMNQEFLGKTVDSNNSLTQASIELRENLKGNMHDIYTMPWVNTTDFKDLVVPKGKYFVM
jgi:signal peptidase I